MNDESLRADSLIQLYYGKTVTEQVRRRFPDVRLGVSLLGRSYLFPALHAALPGDIALQSMEAAICWNRGSRVPMENFSAGPGRDMLLVPRLDDDENELAAQFNVTLYQHDRVPAAPGFGVTGVAPQVGKTRGLEQNARFLADAAWEPSLTGATFYRARAERFFDSDAAEIVFEAYLALEAADMFLGLDVPTSEAGPCFCGMGNFLNYNDSRDIGYMKWFERQADPFNGPDFPNWDVSKEEEPVFLRQMRFRCRRFEEAVARYRRVLDCLRQAEPRVLPGARNELTYLTRKTESFILHLDTLCALMRGHLAYDAAFRAKRKGDWDGALADFDECERHFQRARDLATETAHAIAACVDDPTERHILFRYNVRVLRPIQEFCAFIGNVANYHRGLPYWNKVDWHAINP